MNPANELRAAVRQIIRKLLLPKHLRRAASNAIRLYGGPPFGREPFDAPKLYDPSRDLDGQEHAARVRARAIAMRKAGRLHV